MSDYETQTQAAWQEENRQAEWASAREDRDSLRSGLERATEGLDDPPEKIKLDDEPFDSMRRHGNIRADLSAVVDQSFYNSVQTEKREKDQAEFDLIGKKMQRRYGLNGVDGTKRLMNALDSLETQPMEALQFLYREYVEGGAGQQAFEKEYATSVKDVEAFERKYDVAPEVLNLLPDYMSTPEFQRRKTGDNERDILTAVRMVKEGLKRVKMR